jgi:hypothetical protein
MKNLVVFIVLVNSLCGVFAQGEEIGPLTGNPDLTVLKKNAFLKSGNTFDSTFIYFTDTLSLPFFDEFSSNKFQEYDADFSDPGVTFERKYRLLDELTSDPLSNDVFFTLQPTFRRVYDLTTATFVDQYFATTPVKVGNLSSYPVVYTTTNLFPPFYIYDTIGGPPNAPDTVWIQNPEFFQDSATQFFAAVNDPSALWLDRHAYHNYRYAFEPRSLGVVTFDGLDENGYPYAFGSTLTNYADRLTSKPIDLSSFNAGDSVYFSFLYQKQGFGDIPEEGDSLVVDFYAKDLDQWFRVWSTNGGPVGPFEVAHFRITAEKYFKKGFQFRFRNYGSLAGSLDHFHVDYVHLRALSGYQDTLFKDFAFVYPVGSLLKTYTSVPWDHFKNSPTGKMNNAAELVVHNGSNLPENNQNGSIEVYFDGLLEGSYGLPAQNLSGGEINYAPRTTYYSYHDLSGGYEYDNSKPGTKVTFDITAKASAQFPNFAGNDSTFGQQYFANYYSYDDGTAEAAYGPTGNQALLAIKYTAYEADSLIGVRMHFVPSVNNVSNKLFLLRVWADNGGQPGAVIYEDEAFFPRQPQYGFGRNAFVTYYLKDTMKLAVGQTFYIGWRQFDADRLNIGLDRNNDNKDKTFFSLNSGFNWSTSSFEGSVMMHPIFSTAMDAELGVKETTGIEPEVSVFPNPAATTLTVQVAGFSDYLVELYGMDGKILLSERSAQLDLSTLASGVYFIRLPELTQKTFKVIVNR